MTISDLTSLNYKDFKNMNAYERKQVMRDMKRNVKRRLNRLKEKGIVSIASYKLTDDVISAMLDTSNEYIANRNFLQAQKFLRSQTSTVRGHNKWLNNQIKATGVKEIANLNRDELSEMFRIVESLRERNPAFFQSFYDSTQAVAAVEELYTQNKLAGIDFSYQDMVENTQDYIRVLRQQEEFMYASY